MNLLKPTRLVLDALLPANTHLLHQERALGARRRVRMAVMLHRGMITRPRPRAVKPTHWRACPARLWRLENRSTTRTTDLVEDSLGTRRAGALVTELLASMRSALQRAAARPQADMVGLVLLVGVKHGVLLALCDSPLRSALLTCAADLVALVAATVHLGAADAGAFGALDVAEVAG